MRFLDTLKNPQVEKIEMPIVEGGLRTTAKHFKGEPVVAYQGEWVSETEVDIREEAYKKEGVVHSYAFKVSSASTYITSNTYIKMFSFNIHVYRKHTLYVQLFKITNSNNIFHLISQNYSSH